MAKQWDDSIKRLIRINPQHFVWWVLKDAIYQNALSLELKNLTREADALLAATWRGEEILIHFEFQSNDHELMEERALEYNVMARREHRRPVYSIIVYLRKGNIEEPFVWTFPDGEEILRFHFAVIRLGEMSADEIIQTGLTTLLPLIPLTKDGKQYDVAGTMIERIVATERPTALLGLAKAFTDLVFTDEADQKWIERSFAVYKDILDESWVVQEWKAEGKAKGIEEGKIKGKIEGLRQALADLFQLRFPEIAPAARVKINTINDPEHLRHLIVHMNTVQEPEEALEMLFDTSYHRPTSPGEEEGRA